MTKRRSSIVKPGGGTGTLDVRAADIGPPVPPARGRPSHGLPLRRAMRLVIDAVLWDAYADDEADALPEAWGAFSDAMARGVVVAVGRPAGSLRVAPVDAAAWAAHVHPDLDYDRLTVGGADVFDVAVHAPVDLPDVASRLAGRAMVEAFDTVVVANPWFRSAVEGVDGSLIVTMARSYAFDCGGTLAGRGPLPSGAWPVTLDRHDVARSWIVEGGSLAGVRREVGFDALELIDAAADRVARVFRRFLAPILSGAVELHGRHIRSGRADRVDRAALVARGAALDMAAGALGTESNGTFHAEWSALELRTPAAAPCVRRMALTSEVEDGVRRSGLAMADAGELAQLRVEVERLRSSG